VSENGVGDKKWRDAVDDATWVLGHLNEVHGNMVAVIKATKKRKYVFQCYCVIRAS